ncbi:extracellular solute-binding protein [Halorhabdus sp. BNX81]|uniref:extracellular solute-binding protein n=1 Tax=Halorhabdus sp. BNX81 TaxID=2980181 RepID=UPI0023DD57F7|nr:extracellular solute-binding protein [Halorhabdus sp. BNX81]WEL20642.1 ABC-type molybdate transport system, periplasmiccomponent [Halorhabdus sp. BNX81]
MKQRAKGADGTRTSGKSVPSAVAGTHTRRGILTGVAGLATGLLAGCLGGERTASVLAAGSLASAFGETVGPAFKRERGYAFEGEYRGSNAVMRMVADGQRNPDAVVSADAGLLRERLRPETADWDVVFATNAVVIAYNPSTPTGSRLADGEPWPTVLADADAEIGRTDPDLDPLGYRAVQLFDLAARYYDRPELADRLRANTTVDPQEAHLLAAVETGDRAAAVAYRNMAVDRDLPFRDLPPELNFADPALADHYATATYTTEEGREIRGRPIRYNATVPAGAPRPEAGRAFVGFLARRPDLLERAGLVVPAALPRAKGDPPGGVVP